MSEISGVYMIKNKINNEPYVGKSVDIKKRWSNHEWKLNNNRHENAYLQNAWNKYGSNSFEFKIIKECEEEYLDELELFYIQFYDSLNNGYNLTEGGEGSSGYKHTEEAKKKISKANTGNKHSSETKMKMSKSMRGRIPWNKGKLHSEEDKMEMSKGHNSSGFFRVSKRPDKTCKQQFLWQYQYYDEDRKRKNINSVDLSKLMLKVTLKDLPWKILDIDKAIETIRENNIT